MNARNAIQASPLHSATFGGNLECIRALVDKGAKVTTADTDGVTPILISCHQVEKDEEFS